MEYSELSKLSIEELRSLNTMVIQVIKNKTQMKAYGVKESLYVGATVIVNHNRLRNELCKVTKINRTKVVINDRFNVPMSIVTLKS